MRGGGPPSPGLRANDLERIQRFEMSLPEPPSAVANYIPLTRVGTLLMTSGILPMREGTLTTEGSVGSYNVTLEDAQEAARQCILNALSLIRQEVGTLARVRRVVKLTGYVASAQSFYLQPQVMNAASDLLVEVFGDRGRHIRSAVGVYSLPLNAPVELELTVEA